MRYLAASATSVRHVGQVRQEVVLGRERVVEGARSGEQRRVLEDRVARVGHQAHVAGVGKRATTCPRPSWVPRQLITMSRVTPTTPKRLS